MEVGEELATSLREVDKELATVGLVAVVNDPRLVVDEVDGLEVAEMEELEDTVGLVDESGRVGRKVVESPILGAIIVVPKVVDDSVSKDVVTG
jgi:hypothetical protein